MSSASPRHPLRALRDDMRGRVMATFSMAFLGVAPLGSLAVGWLAHLTGIRPTLFLCGVLTLLAGALHRRQLKQQTVR